MQIIELNDYQQSALVTATFTDDLKIIYPALGLNGEAGEFSKEKCTEIAKELGDCLWYVAVMADSIGYSLQEIAQMNIEKLRSRQQRNKIHGNGDNR